MVVVAVAEAASGAKASADFTVSEVFGLGGTLQNAITGICPEGSAVVTDGRAVFAGPAGVFTGRKEFDCGAGTTFTLKYQAQTLAGSPTDAGTWQVVGGTGSLTGLKGNGKLVGTFTEAGVDDHYTGTFTIPG
jgi:hypothetical protein